MGDELGRERGGGGGGVGNTSRDAIETGHREAGNKALEHPFVGTGKQGGKQRQKAEEEKANHKTSSDRKSMICIVSFRSSHSKTCQEKLHIARIRTSINTSKR